VSNRRGFTIVEVLVAMMLLLVGIIAYVGSSATVTTLTMRGNRSARAAFIAQERMETLRATPCPLLVAGSEVRANIYTLTWTVTDFSSGRGKRVRVINSYRRGRSAQLAADTTENTILCTI